MQTYKYHAETKVYLYSEKAFLDPLESKAQGRDVWLLPANSTFTPPLADKPGYAVCWNGKEWEHREDHRQKQDRNGEHPTGQGTPYWMPGDTWQTPARYMTDLGPLPKGAMLARPAKPAKVLEAEALTQAKAERAAAVAALTVEVDGMVFDGDEKAQERMSRAVNMADSLDEETEWVLADNTVAVVTADQLRRACRAAGKAQTTLWVKPYTS